MARPIRSQLVLPMMAAAGLAVLGGCSGPFVSPIPPPPYRDRVPASYDATWRALVRALIMENVPLRVVAKDSGVVSSDDFISPIGVYADCGRLGDVGLEGEALVGFTVFLQRGNGGGTEVQVNVKMSTHVYRRGNSGWLKTNPVFQCVSTGRWEANLIDSMRHLLKE